MLSRDLLLTILGRKMQMRLTLGGDYNLSKCSFFKFKPLPMLLMRVMCRLTFCVTSAKQFFSLLCLIFIYLAMLCFPFATLLQHAIKACFNAVLCLQSNLVLHLFDCTIFVPIPGCTVLLYLLIYRKINLLCTRYCIYLSV